MSKVISLLEGCILTHRPTAKIHQRQDIIDRQASFSIKKTHGHSGRRHRLWPVSPATAITPTTKFSQNNCVLKYIIAIVYVILSLANLSLSQTSEVQQTLSRYKIKNSATALNGRQQTTQFSMNQAISTPQNLARGLVPEYRNESDYQQREQSMAMIVRRNTNVNTNKANSSNNMMKSVRSIVAGSSISTILPPNSTSTAEDICADRLCYRLPNGCVGGILSTGTSPNPVTTQSDSVGPSGSECTVLVTSKRFIDPNRPISRDILFELIAFPAPDKSNYAAVGFSETGRMQGLVSECLQYRDSKTQLQIIKLKHSYNIPGIYSNVPVTILSGIKNLGVSFEDGYYQCRWIVESAVEFSYEASNGSIINLREDLGYKNYHILLASGDYNENTDVKGYHTERVSSMMPVSLAQTGHIESLGSHILIRIHGSLMIAIWVGLVTLSIVLARYYKNEWSNSKINDLAIWFIVHRTLMLISWFGSIIAVIFAYMYTETYHPGLHQLSGTTCLVLTTIQILGGLLRPSLESTRRVYFNWTHFVCGNFSYLCAMICLITAAFLAPAHLPPLYIWVIVIFVLTYALAHTMMTIHQYIVHKSSKISITPMGDLNSSSSTTYTTCGFVADSYPKEVNSPFRQFMLGIFVTVIVIFIVLLISLVNIK